MSLQIPFPAIPLFSHPYKTPGVYPNSIRKGQKMTQQTAKPDFINNSSRCAHRYANGMRCRLLTPDADSLYCANHAAPLENQRASTDTASLIADLKEFRSAIPINEFLARLLLFLAQDRISPRKAAVLAYITNQLLRTLPAIDAELNPKPDKDEPTQIIFDMPGPDRDKTPMPEPTYADLRT
jgi:hypothetical protein